MISVCACTRPRLLCARDGHLGYQPYGTNCLVHKFKEAGGCEAEMMFVRPGFNEGLVRRYCMAQRPHSCGPGAWSLPADRRGWSAQMKEWAAAEQRAEITSLDPPSSPLYLPLPP